MNKKNILIILITIIGVFFISVIGYFVINNPPTFVSGDGVLLDEEQERILEKVQDHFLISINEEPVVTKIENINELVDQQRFYAPADNGDYLIILPNSRKAIIYSEKKDVLLNVGPVLSE